VSGVDQAQDLALVAGVGQRAIGDRQGQLGVVVVVQRLHSQHLQRELQGRRNALVRLVAGEELLGLDRRVDRSYCRECCDYDRSADGCQDDHSFHQLVEERRVQLACRQEQLQQGRHCEKHKLKQLGHQISL